MQILTALIRVTVLIACVSACANTNGATLPKSAKDAIGCLLSNPIVVEQLKDLKVHLAQVSPISYQMGAIGNIIPEPNLISVIIYSNDGKSGRLFFVSPKDGKYQVIHNDYYLSKLGSHWEASEGNGGYATYEEIGNFVTRLSSGEKFQVKLAPNGANCIN